MPITARCADDRSAWRLSHAVEKYLQVVYDPRVWHVIFHDEITITAGMLGSSLD